MDEQRQSYASAAARGGAWATLQSVANKVATVGATWVVARQLSTEQYGAANVAIALSTAFVVFAPTSMSDVLVAHQQRFDGLAARAATMMRWVGLGMLALSLALVPVAMAGYSGYPGWTLGGLLAATAFRPLLDALGVVSQAALRCRLEYRRIAFIDGGVQFGATALTVGMALGGAGALSLVLPQVLAAGVKSVLYRRGAGRRADAPPAQDGSTLWREFATMALGQYVHNVLVMLEILVLGLVVSESEAGIFSFAFVLAVQANAIIGFQVGGVLQPIFGRLAGEPDRQQASYLRAMRTLGMGIVAISCMQAALAPSLFRLAFDARWEPSIAVFMVLSVGQAFYFGTAPTMALLKAQRRFGAYLAWQGTQLAVAGALFFVAARHGGVLAVAWASAGTWALGVVAASCAAVRAGARRGLLAVFAGPWLVSLPVAAASWAAASWLDGLGLAGSAVAVLILGPLGLGAIVLSTRWTAPAVWCDARAASRSVLRRIPARMVPERWRTGA